MSQGSYYTEPSCQYKADNKEHVCTQHKRDSKGLALDCRAKWKRNAPGYHIPCVHASVYNWNVFRVF